jgi:hypothetical protein
MRQEQMFLVLMGVVEEGEESREEELGLEVPAQPLGVVEVREELQLPSLVEVQKQNLQRPI